MINIIMKTMFFLNALERIPKQMEQYKTENAKLEKDLPTLREVAGGTWEKYEEPLGKNNEEFGNYSLNQQDEDFILGQ